MVLPWHLYLMALLYLCAGINHFRVPRLYVTIIPPLLPNPRLLNQIAGIFEIVLALLLCIPLFSPYAAIGVIILLVAIFPANVSMYLTESAGLGLPKWLLLLRLPLQLVLMIWAYQYT